jgi:hypothetical protein
MKTAIRLATTLAALALLIPSAASAHRHHEPLESLSAARAKPSAERYVGGPVVSCTKINKTAVTCTFYQPGAPRPTDQWGEPPHLFTAVVILHVQLQLMQVKTVGEPALGYAERL